MVKLGASFGDVGEPEERDYLELTCYMKKHKGKTWRQVLDEDPQYVEFILMQTDVKLSERLRDELTWALEDL